MTNINSFNADVRVPSGGPGPSGPKTGVTTLDRVTAAWRQLKRALEASPDKVDSCVDNLQKIMGEYRASAHSVDVCKLHEFMKVVREVKRLCPQVYTPFAEIVFVCAGYALNKAKVDALKAFQGKNKALVEFHFKQIAPLFNDHPILLFQSALALVIYHPDFLIEHLGMIPLRNREEIAQIRALLRTPQQKLAFDARYQFTADEIAKTKQNYVTRDPINKWVADNQGICLGYTTLIASNPAAAHNNDSYRKARFLQMSAELSESMKERSERLQLYSSDRTKKINARLAEIDAVGNSTDALKGEKAKLVDEMFDLTTYVFRSKGLSKLDPAPVPTKVLKRLNLKDPVKVQDVTSIGHLREVLADKIHLKGTFELELHREPNGKNHAIYVSFDPPCFCDINHRSLITDIPTRHTFATADEMVAALADHVLLTYGEEFPSFFIRRN